MQNEHNNQRLSKCKHNVGFLSSHNKHFKLKWSFFNFLFLLKILIQCITLEHTIIETNPKVIISLTLGVDTIKSTSVTVRVKLTCQG